jgi:putative oxidoreductase
MRTKNLCLEICCSLLVALFVYASLMKFMHFQVYMEEMHKQVFPEWMGSKLIYIVPTMEIMIAVGLCFRYLRGSALYASLALMCLFTIYALAVLTHVFTEAPCSCGGIISLLTWKQHVIFNLFFVGVTVAAIYLRKSSLPTGASVVGHLNHNKTA